MSSLVLRSADLSRWLRVMILLGYPCVAVLANLLPPTQGIASYAFRALVLGFAITLLAMSLHRLRQSVGLLVVVAFLLLYLIRLLADLVFFMPERGLMPLLLFTGIVFLPPLAIVVRGVDDQDDGPLARALVVVGFFLTFYFVTTWATGTGYNAWADVGGETDRLALAALNPISIGNASAVVMLAAVTLLVRLKVRGAFRLLAILTVCMAILSLYLANSRGPLVAGAAALLWLSAANLRRGWIVLAGIAGVAAYAGLYLGLLENVVSRFELQFTGTDSESLRLVFINQAIEAFLSHPLFGAFYLAPGNAPGEYPHNLFIETAMALGLVGLLLLAVMLVMAAVRVVSFYGKDHPLLTALLIHQLLALQFSGSILGADSFFMLLALAVATRRRGEAAAQAGPGRPALRRMRVPFQRAFPAQ